MPTNISSAIKRSAIRHAPLTMRCRTSSLCAGTSRLGFTPDSVRTLMLPSLFVSHGAPTLLLDDVPVRSFLASYTVGQPRPEAIVVVSAHWEAPQVTVSSAAQP